MSGYNRFEQAVGAALDRFPRAKSAVETTYQRVNYHLANRGGFDYELHEDAELVPAEEWVGLQPETVTRFVGFYDICPWSQDMDRVLVHELGDTTGAETKTHDDTATIVSLSTDGPRRLATTNAWNYQQGSRLQWHPARENWILFNDIEGGAALARVVSCDGETVVTYPYPVHATSPTGDEYLSTDFRRADRNSSGYGYGTLNDEPLESADSDGIVRVSLEERGQTVTQDELIVPLSELIAATDTSASQNRHYIHHVLYAPDGERFVFLHRWIQDGIRHTRLYVSDTAGNTECLLENQYLSHFSWLDPERLFLWGGTESDGRGYYILNTSTGEISIVDALVGHGDGHPSVSPDGRWIVTDTYPDRARRRSLWLYNLDTDESIKLGEFLAPFGFDGPTRCDLHPRWSPDGTLISIDSTFTGTRRSYIINVGPIVKPK